MHLEPEPHALCVEDVEDRAQALGDLFVSALDLAESFGGNEYSSCQIGEPVNPLTCVTPKAAAARAVSFIRSAARRRTPSGSPSPQISGGRIAW